MKYELSKKKDELHVLCTVPPALKNTPPTIVKTSDILEWLSTNHPEIKVFDELKSGRANNSGQDNARTGLWVFSLKDKTAAPKATTPPPKKEKTPAKKRTKRSTTTAANKKKI